MTTAPGTTADVLVLGAGPGGLSAAVSSARAGARTLLVEADTQVGGNAVLSTGYLALLNNDLQRQQGIRDSAEAFLADLTRESEQQALLLPTIFDRTLARLFVEGTAETARFLTELGVTFGRLVRRPAQHSVDRMASVVRTEVLRTGFEPLLDQLGVEVLLGTRAYRINGGPGQWSVETVDSDGREQLLTATRSVVLATGGYQGNPQLRERYQLQSMADRPHLGLATCRGDGHLMASALGADLVNMPAIPSLVIVASAFIEDAIAVNCEGRRFHDEAGPYEDRVAALLAQPGQCAHYVYDQATARRRELLIAQMPEPTLTSETLEGLADQLGCPASELETTVAAWNQTVSSGSTPDAHGRILLPASGAGVLEPPFSAVPLVVGVQFPAGGCRVTTSMAVVDVWGRPMPGLYAVGDCVGGVNAAAGLGGIHIASALTLGRIAGRAAAEQDPGTPTALAAAGLSSGGDPAGGRVELIPLSASDEPVPSP